MYGMAHIELELIPQPTWNVNLRLVLKASHWKKLSKSVRDQSGEHCSLCGRNRNGRPLECHERWEYDDVQRIQRLVGLEALCKACHEVRHFGRAVSMGHGKRAAAHLRKVNGWTAEELDQHVEKAFDKWLERSNHSWTVDISWLDTLFNTLC